MGAYLQGEAGKREGKEREGEGKRREEKGGKEKEEGEEPASPPQCFGLEPPMSDNWLSAMSATLPLMAVSVSLQPRRHPRPASVRDMTSFLSATGGDMFSHCPSVGAPNLNRLQKFVCEIP